MSRRWGLIFIAALAAGIWGCGDDDGGPTTATNEPPGAVADLSAIAIDDSMITLAWSAPGDPSKRTSVSAYDLRYSTANITEENWEEATAVEGEPAPREAEVADTFTVEGLDLGASYYFALKSVDNEDEWSGLSNVLQASTDSIDNRLLAYYPLVDDSLDVTGKNGKINLRNTPFEEGGIYCNGIYNDGVDTLACDVWTPYVLDMDFESVTVSVRFKPSEFYRDTHRPALTCGSNRWLEIRLDTNGEVLLRYNNATTVQTGVAYTPGTWHEGVLTVDGSTVTLYLDGTAIATVNDVVLNHDNRANILFRHGGNATMFKGHAGRLKVYSGIVPPQ